MKVYAALALPLLLLAPGLSAQTGPPPASAGIFPLKNVHRGLRGTAWTVFEGTAPEPMGVEVLGLLRNAAGPGEDIILVRLSGTKAEYTGVVAGMSGSPVYFDGKLAGALAFRIGQFSKEPIAGVTPIERMLEVRDLAPSAAKLAPVSTATVAADEAQSNSEMRPIETPLVFSGFTPEALKLWRDHTPSLGLEPVAGLGGASSEDAARARTPLVPGSAVSALLVRGDLEIAATCTATYVDQKHLLACGHPITQFGPVSIPMTRADVVATLPSPLNAFKIVNTTETIGSFTEDRQSAISGVLGLSAGMIPMTIRIADPSAPTRTLHLEVVNQPQLTPSAVLVSVFQSLSESNHAETESSYHVRGTIRVSGQPDVEIDSVAAASDQAPASLAAALTAGEPFSRLYDSPVRRAPITSVDIALERLPGRQVVQITDAHLEQADVRAGRPVTVDVTLEPYRAEPLHRQITFTLPATLEPGTVRLLVSDAGTLDRLTQPGRGAFLDLNATIAQINGARANDRLYVTLLTNNLEATLDGRVLGSLPASAANILEPERAAQKLTLNGESLLPVTSLAASPEMSAVVAGQQVLALRVE